MTENNLIILIRTFMLSKFAARGLIGYDIAQNFQPTQQGRPTQPTVYLYQTANERYGNPRRGHVWSATQGRMVRTEKIFREATFKVMATIPEDLENMAALSQSDAVGIVAAIMQSDDFVAHMQLNACGVLRITSIVNTPIENDLGQNEANYSFDVIITHSDVFIDDVPIITEFDFSTVAI